MTFAETEVTEDGILAFADRFGALGVGEDDFITHCRQDGGRPRSPAFHRGRFILRDPAERFELWKDQIMAMRPVVRLWEILRRGDSTEIAARIKRHEDKKGRRSVVCNVGQSVGARAGGKDDIIHLDLFTTDWNPLGLRHGEAIRPIRLWIANRINAHLEEEVLPRLDPDRGGGAAISFSPRRLVGALWLQFALALAGNAEFRPCGGCGRPCGGCGRPFEVSRSAARSDRQFCSNACRVKAYRERQGRARDLFAEGKSVKEIAGALNCNTEAVKGWVKSGKGTKGKE